MYTRDLNELGNVAGVNLAGSDAQLQLPLVKDWASVQEFGAEHIFVPFPGLLSVGNLDIDMVDHADFRHGAPPFDSVCPEWFKNYAIMGYLILWGNTSAVCIECARSLYRAWCWNVLLGSVRVSINGLNTVSH